MRPFVGIIAALVLASPALGQGPKAAAQTRYFPAQKCRFTLPDGWSWVDRPIGNAFFAAESTDGLLVQATCAPAMAWSEMDERAAEDFERSLARSSRGKLKKRGTSFVSFHGLTAYQIAGVLPDGKTTVSCCFLAHQMAYQILIVGGKEPVEQDPDFDEIMSGFAFTVPPANPAGAPSSSYTGISAIFWIGLAVLYFGFRNRGARKQPPKPMDWRDVEYAVSDVPPAARPATAVPPTVARLPDATVVPPTADLRTQLAPRRAPDRASPPPRRPPENDDWADERDLQRSCVRFVNAISQSFEPKVDGIVAFMAFGLALVAGIIAAVFIGIALSHTPMGPIDSTAAVLTGIVAVIAAAVFCSIRADRAYRGWRYKSFFRGIFLPEAEKRDLPITQIVAVMGRINVSGGSLDERLRGMAKALPLLKELLLEQARHTEATRDIKLERISHLM